MPVYAVNRSAVVVELFESQGCSSCPPAEHAVKQLEGEFGEDVLILVCHVDYWDYLGWKDVFSSRFCTERQKMFGQAFAQDSIYTPEMVIAGEAGFNGSSLRRARSEVQARRVNNPRHFEVSAQFLKRDMVRLSVRIPPELTRDARQVHAVVYEDAPPVHVLRGENRGETMSGDHAVRQWATLPVRPDGSATFTLTLPPGVDPASARVAVLVQGSGTSLIAAQRVGPWVSAK